MTLAKGRGDPPPSPASENVDGAWFVYSWDMCAQPMGLFKDEIDALRFAQSQGYHVHVKFWPFGVEWSDVEHPTRGSD